jgi:hypothetical protein
MGVVFRQSIAVINGSKIVGNNAGHGGLGGNGFPDGPGGDGGGLYTFSGQLMLVNAIIAENTIQPGGSGSGMYLNSFADLFHVTLARNTGGDGSGVFVTYPMVYLTNTIVVSHTVGISVHVDGKVYLEDTLWGSEAWANGVDWSGNGTIITGTRNIWADPLFVNPDGMDYHLSASSPAIDQGIPTSINIDIDNQQRPNPGTNLPDLGADEYWYFRWTQFLPMLYNRRD